MKLGSIFGYFCPEKNPDNFCVVKCRQIEQKNSGNVNLFISDIIQIHVTLNKWNFEFLQSRNLGNMYGPFGKKQQKKQTA